MRPTTFPSLISALVICVFSINSRAASLPAFDLTKKDSAAGWAIVADITAMQTTPEGLLLKTQGEDPRLTTPRFDCPPNRPLWLCMRLKSSQDGSVQVFYYNTHAAEEKSVRVPVSAGQWQTARVALPPLGPGYQLRIDPHPGEGELVLASVAIEERMALNEPQWPVPQTPTLKAESPAIRAGELSLTHAADELGGFVLRVADQPMAIGFNRALLGYVTESQAKWINLRDRAKVAGRRDGEALLVEATFADDDGGAWRIIQRFSPGVGSSIDVETTVTVDKDRHVSFLPVLALCPGVGSFGQSKTQALFAGLEYLDNDEPSSSEADIIGPGAKRQVPDNLKITFPLMTILANGHYLGLIWEPAPALSAVFDSPDRLFKSRGHVMGLLLPGADGVNRTDGHLLPQMLYTLRASAPLTARATIIGGKGPSVIPAVQQYIALRKLPDVPDPGMDLQGYVRLAATGWMDSKGREGERYRHAWPGSFQPNAVADAAVYMDWLASRSTDKQLALRLMDAAKAALAQVKPERYDDSAVSHVRYPSASLLYGGVEENAQRARRHAEGLMRQFTPEGAMIYRPGHMDFAKTHFSREANGLAATSAYRALLMASFCGDRKLIDDGLRLVRAMDKFVNTVPRGAQTWEIPLHTPDILASAYLVHAYALAYELTGEAHYLEMARHWAWTGVPFVYLVNPTGQPVGPYATIAVYGATHWTSVNWLGLPVQWCGLVYSDSLYRLAAYDPAGPWKQIADGITASGIQQTWPIGSNADRQGLLPDSFHLRKVRRNDAAINPGTVQSNAVAFYKQPPLYSFRALRSAGLLVHAPAEITDVRESATAASFKVRGCMRETYYVLIAGGTKAPVVRVNGAEPPADARQFAADAGRLVLRLTGDSDVQVTFAP